MNFSEKAVQVQVEAYNARNMDDFIKWYTDDIKAIDLDTEEIIFIGKKEMIPEYIETFKNQYLHCEIKNRMVLHRTVIDYEKITINENGDTREAIAIYDVEENGLISTVRFTKGKLNGIR